MAKKTAKKTAKKVVKKAVQKVLDSTDLDEKLIAEYKENKSIIDLVLCYIKCYGGYVLAVGAGCTFGVSFLWGLGLLLATAGWAYLTTCNCKKCKKGSCEK
tara:strand:- start:100 stop:402 length:303 start_codon:yes stop_codon:yes gene_type:complete